MSLRPDVPMIKPVKLHANVGACLDIPTGNYIKGKYGESILKGGLPTFFGICGKPNNFKSTILAWLLLRALIRLTNHQSSLSWFDTEVNVELYRLAQLASHIEGYEKFTEENGTVFDHGLWTFTDKATISGNKWISRIQDFLAQKLKDANKYTLESPFPDLDGSLIEMLLPTASAMDSLSEFETEDVMAIRDKTEIGNKDANTLYMRQGLGKDRLVRETPTMTSRGFHFFGFAAQWEEQKPDIGAGPMAPPKQKMMNHSKQSDKMRGVPKSFYYLPLHVWFVEGSKVLKDDDFYPLEDRDMTSEQGDLFVSPMTMWRSKTSGSGYTIPVIVSQTRGVDPSMTEFYNIAKTYKRFGMDGAGQFFTFELAPELGKFQRTTIRKGLARDERLRRVVNITSEMCQIAEYYPQHKDRVPSMKDLREKLNADGYDFELLLNTRSWWTFNNDKQEKPFLSTMDLINMFHGEYVPYWISEDKKSIRPEFRPK